MSDKYNPIGKLNLETERYDKFRAPGSVGWITVSLFADLERCEDPESAPFWLNRNKKGDKRPVFRDWFLHFEDMTGTEVANKFLGNKEHWDKMYEMSGWFREAVDMWRTELKAILRARAMQTVMDIMAEGTGATQLAAAKYLVDKLDGPSSEPAKRGRPSNVEVKGELKKAIKTIEETDEDYARITNHLTVVN